MIRLGLAVLAVAAFSTAFAGVSFGAQVVPEGFATEVVVGAPFSGEPVGFAFLPDGRRILIERGTGIVRLAIPGSTSSAVIATIPGVEAVHPERGLLGVAVDPAWPSRPYLYFYYNHVSANIYITMYTASGALSNPASFMISLAAPFHLVTDIPDMNGIHNGGTLRFGPDGMLYASIGDDGQGCPAQDLSILLGSILRLDVSDMPGTGTGPPAKSAITPPDNPFPGPNENEKLHFAWGLRNPFRFTIDSLTGDLTIGDVGSSFWEEINHLDLPEEAGANFAWPRLEGNQEIFCCPDCGEDNTFTSPIALMQHPVGIISIMGGPVVRGNDASSIGFPSSYEGNIFFFELYSGVMRRLVESAGIWQTPPPVPGQPDSLNWGTGHSGACDVQMGVDGALYYLGLGVSSVPRGLYRIVRTLPTTIPAATPPAPICRATPNPARASGSVVFEIGSQVNGRVVLSLRDVAGRRVRRLAGSSSGNGAILHWDGRDQSGTPLAPGIYLWSLEVNAKKSAGGKITLLR